MFRRSKYFLSKQHTVYSLIYMQTKHLPVDYRT